MTKGRLYCRLPSVPVSPGARLFRPVPAPAPAPPPPPPPPVLIELPEPAATHEFELDAASRQRGGLRAEDPDRQGGHAARYRAPFRRGVRGDAAGEPRSGSVAAGRRPRGRGADPVRAADGAARRRGDQCRGDAHLLLSAAQEGRAAARLHPSRSESAGSAGRPRKAPPKSSVARRTRCGWCRNRCATSMPQDGDMLPDRRPGGSGQSARVNTSSGSAGRAT